MHGPVELVPYDPSYAQAVAQTFLEIFTASPWNETLSLNDILYQLESDYSRPGFGSFLFTSGKYVVGFSWWYDISGRELHEKWRPRFNPKDQIPTPDGPGTFFVEMGVIPNLRNHGLGSRLLKASLEQIEPSHDWIAVNTQRFAHPALALLKSNAFIELGLVGIQVPSRICLLKSIYR